MELLWRHHLVIVVITCSWLLPMMPLPLRSHQAFDLYMYLYLFDSSLLRCAAMLWHFPRSPLMLDFFAGIIQNGHSVIMPLPRKRLRHRNRKTHQLPDCASKTKTVALGCHTKYELKCPPTALQQMLQFMFPGSPVCRRGSVRKFNNVW